MCYFHVEQGKIVILHLLILVTEGERRRLQDAFRRHSNASGHITKQIFLREVLGDSIPITLAEQIYVLCVIGNFRKIFLSFLCGFVV